MNRHSILIEADELLKKLGADNLRIYDATIQFFGSGSSLTAYEQYRQAHIPGAAFFDHQKFSDPASDYMYTALPADRLAGPIGDLGISAETEVVVYTSGALPCATRAWWLLYYGGHNQVRILNGGLAAWQKAGGPIAQGGGQYAPSHFEGRPRPHLFASKEEVMAAMGDGAVRTVNVLPAASYQAAHIVGSTCLPCLDLMRAMDSFLPDAELASRLKEELPYKRIITYCGGGIAATVNAVAHLIAGNENVAVYDGSLYEWVGEGLPLTETGNGNWAIWG